MDIKQAVKVAKDYVVSVFAEDGGSEFALEEVDFDHEKSDWLITISFRRNSEFARMPNLNKGYGLLGMFPRFQKVVRINSDTGKILSVKNREPDMAA